MNAKQKIFTLCFVPSIILLDWFFGAHRTDAVVYSLIGLFVGISFYAVFWAFRSK